jgi:hypothetical protein
MRLLDFHLGAHIQCVKGVLWIRSHGAHFLFVFTKLFLSKPILEMPVPETQDGLSPDVLSILLT